ncbi:MAG: DUF6883 domain-containing protein [Stellaceae bacterium]
MQPDDGPGAQLPFSDRAFVEEKKIQEYLLNPDHPVGGSKAKFFIARLLANRVDRVSAFP